MADAAERVLAPDARRGARTDARSASDTSVVRRAAGETVIELSDVRVEARERVLLDGVDLAVRRGEVLTLIGPSGAGKSTLLKVMNRMVELESPPLRVTGSVRLGGCLDGRLDGRSIYEPGVDADDLRRSIGILFQQPVLFPASIRDNVLFGALHHERLSRPARRERLEKALREAALWDEVHHRLDEPAANLSVGQQQRLCLARALAVEPGILLMDEPTSALDRSAAAAIEALIGRLAEERAVVVVTHDLDQARRIADRIACVCVEDGRGHIGEVVRRGDPFFDRLCRDTVIATSRDERPRPARSDESEEQTG